MRTVMKPAMKNALPLKASLLALMAGSVLFAGQLHATSINPEGQASAEQREYRSAEHKGEHHRGHSGMFKFLRKIELSDEQKADVKAIMTKYQQERTPRPTQEQHQAHRAEMLALITQGDFDESAAQALVQAQQQKHQGAMVNKLKMQNEIYQLLNDDQKSQFTAQFTQMSAKHSRR